MTKNGKLILEIVHGSSEHPTAEQIFMKAREKSPGIALATVYNNLNSLVSEKLIRRIRQQGVNYLVFLADEQQDAKIQRNGFEKIGKVGGYSVYKDKW